MRRIVAAAGVLLLLTAIVFAVAWGRPLAAAASVLAVNFGLVPLPANVTVERTTVAGVPAFRAAPSDRRCPCPRLVVSLGVAALPGDDPLVDRLLRSLASAGYEVVLAEPGQLAQGQIDEAAIASLGAVLASVRAEAPDRPLAAGGFSSGASLLFVAALDRAVPLDGFFWFGGYADLDRLRYDLACGLLLPDGRPWDPDPWALELAAQQELARDFPVRCGRPEKTATGQRLSPQPRAEATAQRFPVFLLHDAADRYVPWTESRAMHDALTRRDWPSSLVLSDLFEHVTPRGVDRPQALLDAAAIVVLLARFLATAG